MGVNEPALQVLSDPEKREIYDEFGEQGIKEGMGKGGHGPSSPMDIFEMFFGGGASSNGGSRANSARKTKPMAHRMTVTLEELYCGKTRKVAANRDRACGRCEGKGGTRSSKCRTCGGRGVRVRVVQIGPGMMQQSQTTCSDCSGRGETVDAASKCADCNGKGAKRDKKVLKVRIEPGMPSNHK